jgi:hypothetical protein
LQVFEKKTLKGKTFFWRNPKLRVKGSRDYET